jgi:hypothetical protein
LIFKRSFDNIHFMSKKETLEERIRKSAKDGEITCALIRKIAEETGTSYQSAGKAADELKIKIKNCDLGCF